jgi:hypothetical protein
VTAASATREGFQAKKQVCTLKQAGAEMFGHYMTAERNARRWRVAFAISGALDVALLVALAGAVLSRCGP